MSFSCGFEYHNEGKKQRLFCGILGACLVATGKEQMLVWKDISLLLQWLTQLHAFKNRLSSLHMQTTEFI